MQAGGISDRDFSACKPYQVCSTFLLHSPLHDDLSAFGSSMVVLAPVVAVLAQLTWRLSLM